MEKLSTERRGSDPGYLDWEGAQAALHGLRVVCLAGVIGSGLLLLADWLLFQGERLPLALPSPIARAALALSLVVAAGVGISTFSKRGEHSRPLLAATGVTLVTIAAGALGASAAGGVDGYYPYGLLPVLLIWTAAMPVDGLTAAPPLLGGLVLHIAILRLTAWTEWGPRAIGTLSLFGVLVIFGLSLSEVVDRLRRQRSAASRLDALTGVFHRDSLMEELRLLCSRRTREEAPVSLVLFDLDRFRLMNAAHGHTFGDQVLQMTGVLVRSCVRAHDLVGRYGADEFLLVLDGCNGEQAVQLVERIRSQLAERPLAAGDTTRITFSAGIVCAQEGVPLNADDLRVAAERALQESKDAQLNRTVLGPTPESGTAQAGAIGPSGPMPSQGPAAVIWNFPPPPSLTPVPGAIAATGAGETPPSVPTEKPLAVASSSGDS